MAKVVTGTPAPITLNVNSPNITSPTIDNPIIIGGSLHGSGLMDNSGRYGLYVNSVWNGNYGILMYDTNSDGKNTWVCMPTRINEGQLGHANSFITALTYQKKSKCRRKWKCWRAVMVHGYKSIRSRKTIM